MLTNIIDEIYLCPRTFEAFLNIPEKHKSNFSFNYKFDYNYKL